MTDTVNFTLWKDRQSVDLLLLFLSLPAWSDVSLAAGTDNYWGPVEDPARDSDNKITTAKGQLHCVDMASEIAELKYYLCWLSWQSQHWVEALHIIIIMLFLQSTISLTICNTALYNSPANKVSTGCDKLYKSHKKDINVMFMDRFSYFSVVHGLLLISKYCHCFF